MFGDARRRAGDNGPGHQLASSAWQVGSQRQHTGAICLSVRYAMNFRLKGNTTNLCQSDEAYVEFKMRAQCGIRSSRSRTYLKQTNENQEMKQKHSRDFF